MTDINIIFSRQLLKKATEMLRAYAPHIGVNKSAWVYKFHEGSWEFQGPNAEGDRNKFYWSGSADNAYEARYNGWMAWFEKYYPQVMEGEDEE